MDIEQRVENLGEELSGFREELAQMQADLLEALETLGTLAAGRSVGGRRYRRPPTDLQREPPRSATVGIPLRGPLMERRSLLPPLGWPRRRRRPALSLDALRPGATVATVA